MSLKQITAPALAVDLATAKVELRVQSGNAEDAQLTRWINGATERAEHETGRAVMDQEWELILDAFPAAEIELAKSPLRSITSVTYLDAAGVLQTLSGSAYSLDADKQPGWLFPAEGTSWPATQDVANAVRVRFRCGYATTPAELAEKAPGIVNWIMVQVATQYDNRDLVALAKADADPGCYGARLLDPYRTYA